MFVSNLKTFAEGIPEILCSRKWKDRQSENLMLPATAITGMEEYIHSLTMTTVTVGYEPDYFIVTSYLL